MDLCRLCCWCNCYFLERNQNKKKWWDEKKRSFTKFACPRYNEIITLCASLVYFFLFLRKTLSDDCYPTVSKLVNMMYFSSERSIIMPIFWNAPKINEGKIPKLHQFSCRSASQCPLSFRNAKCHRKSKTLYCYSMTVPLYWHKCRDVGQKRPRELCASLGKGLMHRADQLLLLIHGSTA